MAEFDDNKSEHEFILVSEEEAATAAPVGNRCSVERRA